MTTGVLFGLFIIIAFFSGCIGYFLGSGITRALIERHYHLINKE
jgi:hypothetical protein